jgi:hypothetical protein
MRADGMEMGCFEGPYDGDVRIEFSQVLKHLESVHFGHFNVEEDDVRLERGEFC